MLVLDLGQLQVGSNPLPKSSLTQIKQKLQSLQRQGADTEVRFCVRKQTLTNMVAAVQTVLLDEEEIKRCYDRIRVDLRSVHIFMATHGPKWQSQGVKTTLLGPFDIGLNVDKCVAPDIVWLYRMKLDGKLPVCLA